MPLEVIIITVIFLILLIIEQNIRGYPFSFNALFLLYGYLYSIGPFFNEEVYEEYGRIQFICVVYAYIISITVSDLILNKKNKSYFLYPITGQGNILKAVMIFIVLLCFFVMYYIVFVKVGLDSYIFESRSGRAIITRQYSYLMFFKDVICAIAALSLMQYLIVKDKFYLRLWGLCFSFSIIYAFLTISRSHLLVTVFPVLFLLCYFKYIKGFIVNIILVAGILFALAWKWLLYSLIFGGDVDISTFSISLPSELFQWAIITDNMESEELLYGKSFLDAAKSMIYPFYDVEPLSIWYVNKFEPEIAMQGGGRGFSLFAEIVLNFGYVGLPLIYALIGISFGLLTNSSRVSAFSVYMIAVSLPYLHKFFRSEFISITKTWWWYYIVPIFIIILMAAFFKKVVLGYRKTLKYE